MNAPSATPRLDRIHRRLAALHAGRWPSSRLAELRALRGAGHPAPLRSRRRARPVRLRLVLDRLGVRVILEGA